MDGFVDQPPYHYVTEISVRESYPITCKGGAIIDLGHDEASLMALALQAYFDRPENVAKTPEQLHIFMKAPGDLEYIDNFKTVRIGAWMLTCSGPMRYTWSQRPQSTISLLAPLGWDPDKEIWFVKDMFAQTIKRR